MNTTTRVTIALVVCATAAFTQPVTITVTNPLPERRDLETIEVSWNDLGPLSSSRLTVTENARPLVSQVIDAHGRPALLLFQASFGPLEKKTFTVQAGDPVQASGPTDAQFVMPRQDLAWENDRIAFRMYGSVLAGDVNNGIDVWCKRVRYPIVERWYAASAKAQKDSYHEDHGEGADFFSVGRSLGAGSCALLAGDSLLQPGLFNGHHVLATGPIRAMFELRYDSADAGGRKYHVLKRISLDAGSNLNRIEVVYSGFPAQDTLVVAAGLVLRANTTSVTDPGKRWIALWGPTNADTVNGSLGTGVVMPGQGRTRETTRHILMTGTALPDRPFVYYAGAAWTRAGEVTTRSAWEALLGAAARRLNAPLVVVVGPHTK
jgi:pectinesterase